MKKFICIAAMLVSLNIHAEGEMDGWYTSNNGLYLVREMVYGKLYGQMTYSKSNQIRFYIIDPNDQDCVKKIGTDIISHDPLYINKKLVRMNQYCDANIHYYYPATDEGNSFVIKQFNNSESVEIKMYDDSIRFIFSGKNFKNIYAQLIGKSGGI